MSETPPKYRTAALVENPISITFASVELGDSSKLFLTTVYELVAGGDNTPILNAQLRALRIAVAKLEDELNGKDDPR